VSWADSLRSASSTSAPSWPEPSRRSSVSSKSAGTVTWLATVVVVVLVGVVVVLVLVVLVLVEGRISAVGSSRGAGFCHTDRDVEAPKLGNRLSRIA
jgi:hypothetical protein